MNYVRMSPSGVVKMSGSEGIDLLHRISTNDVSSLQDGESRDTILTTDKGRIVDIITIIRRSADVLVLCSWSGNVAAMRTWIEKFIIMENVSVNEEDRHRYILFGEETRHFDGDWIRFMTSIGKATLENILVSGPHELKLRELLRGGGLTEVGVREFDEYRIRMGIPGWPGELSPEINPLEAGLESLVSWTKGCYVGQEVIARLDTYKKVQKHLMLFDMAEKPLKLPAPIEAEGLEAGYLTSVTSKAPFVGMGYVRTGKESSPLRAKNGRGENIVLTNRGA